jgi:hypothetical protein
MREAGALALRRGVLAAACVGPTVTAHAASHGGGVRVSPLTAVACLAIVAVAAAAGTGRRRLRPLGPLTLFAVLAAGQAAAHAAMTLAPWAFALEVHHAAPALTAGAALAHLVVLLVLTVLLVLADRLLAGAVALLAALRRMLARRLGPMPTGGRPAPVGFVLARARAGAPARPRAPPSLRIA